MEQELQKLLKTQVPIKTKTGGRFLDFVVGVNPGVVIMATNADGTGRRTVLSIDSIESFTIGGTDGAAAAGGSRPNWMPAE